MPTKKQTPGTLPYRGYSTKCANTACGKPLRYLQIVFVGSNGGGYCDQACFTAPILIHAIRSGAHFAYVPKRRIVRR